MERRHHAERQRLRVRMDDNVNNPRKNVQFTTHTAPQNLPNRNNNNRYLCTRQDIGDRVNESAQQRQNSYVEENRPIINTERNRPVPQVDRNRGREIGILDLQPNLGMRLLIV